MGFSQYFKGRNGGWFPGSKHFFMSPDIFHELASKLPTIESRLAQCISFLCFTIYNFRFIHYLSYFICMLKFSYRRTRTCRRR